MIGEPTPLIYESTAEIYTKQGITFDALKHLDTIGLISYESISGYARTGFGKYAHAFYYGRPTAIEFGGDTNNQLDIGHALLTSVGKELAPICGSSTNDDFYHYVLRKWFENGLILSSIAIAER